MLVAARRSRIYHGKKRGTVTRMGHDSLLRADDHIAAKTAHVYERLPKLVPVRVLTHVDRTTMTLRGGASVVRTRDGSHLELQRNCTYDALVNRAVSLLCILLSLTTPNAAWALAKGDCASDSMEAVDQTDHSEMDHSNHSTGDAFSEDLSEDTCSCCADGCANHCAGGFAFIRLALVRAVATNFDHVTGPTFGAVHLPSPPIFGLFRPPIVS